jgi:hypothetical protein
VTEHRSVHQPDQLWRQCRPEAAAVAGPLVARLLVRALLVNALLAVAAAAPLGSAPTAGAVHLREFVDFQIAHVRRPYLAETRQCPPRAPELRARQPKSRFNLKHQANATGSDIWEGLHRADKGAHGELHLGASLTRRPIFMAGAARKSAPLASARTSRKSTICRLLISCGRPVVCSRNSANISTSFQCSRIARRSCGKGSL